MWGSMSPKGFLPCVCLGEEVTPCILFFFRGVPHVSGQDPFDFGGPFGAVDPEAQCDLPPGAPPSSSPPRSPKSKAAR